MEKTIPKPLLKKNEEIIIPKTSKEYVGLINESVVFNDNSTSNENITFTEFKNMFKLQMALKIQKCWIRYKKN